MISDIHLQQFRLYKDASFEFEGGVNIIVGPNASGKTSLLEALLVAARGSSYRAQDVELIMNGSDWTRIDARVGETDTRTIKIRNGTPAKKTQTVGDKEYTRLPHGKQLPVVVFEPNHLLILQGPPEGRRNYLDELLEQTIPNYAAVRKNYRRVLAQRNALLKQPHSSEREFFPWNLRLSELGAVIHRQRNQLVVKLNEAAGALYTELSQSPTELTLQYESRFTVQNYETNLLRSLEANLKQEKQKGFTSYGPHREDMLVLFDGKETGAVASRGETRTAVLVLKILELKTVAEAIGVEPVLLLDDVFSELDGHRRKLLTTHIEPYQTFITTTDADIVVQNFTETCNVLALE